MTLVLVSIRVVEEPPVNELGLLSVELLPAVWALELSSNLDADMFETAIARLNGIHGLDVVTRACKVSMLILRPGLILNDNW